MIKFICIHCTLYLLVVTCSKRLLHWEKHCRFSVYSLAPTPLTRTTTTFWILPAQAMLHHLGCIQWPSTSCKDANTIRSLMFEILSGERACPSLTLNRCCEWGMTFGCSKKNIHLKSYIVLTMPPALARDRMANWSVI